MDDFTAVISRHERIALQLSGGKDSIACVYLLREHWDKMTVYWLDAGDSFPETISAVSKIREMVPHFAVVRGRQPEVIAEFGMPSDVVPVSSTPVGIAGAGAGVAIQDRYSCCVRSIMLPMHERMIADGITLIIRGQKNADRLKSPIRSGDVVDGVEVLFPVQDWSSRQVLAYLRDQGAPVPRFYEMLNAAPDCMACTGWWEEGVSAYLRRYHPAAHAARQAKLQVIGDIVNAHIATFNRELEP